MSLKECVEQEISSLDETDLQRVALFISNMKTRARRMPSKITPVMAMLYAQFAKEDSELAEEGMSDFARGLQGEDR